MVRLVFPLLLAVTTATIPFASAWTTGPLVKPCAITTTTTTATTKRTTTTGTVRLLPRSMSSISTSETNNNNDNNANTAADDDALTATTEWEYVEFDRLTESDLVNSEWLVGTCWDNRPNAIDETWCRLITKDGGGGGFAAGVGGVQNVAIWGDNSQGKWSLDVATQYVTISKTRPWGKQIWACLVDDYYYMRGTVRGWSFWAAAAVDGQWQARRLGVDPEEAGEAPWFASREEEEGEAQVGTDLKEV